MSDELVDIEHPDLDGTQTVTSRQARVLAKSGWRRATTARPAKKKAAKRLANSNPPAPTKAATIESEED